MCGLLFYRRIMKPKADINMAVYGGLKKFPLENRHSFITQALSQKLVKTIVARTINF